MPIGHFPFSFDKSPNLSQRHRRESGEAKERQDAQPVTKACSISHLAGMRFSVLFEIEMNWITLYESMTRVSRLDARAYR